MVKNVKIYIKKSLFEYSIHEDSVQKGTPQISRKIDNFSRLFRGFCRLDYAGTFY